jgi:hypothetical protein
MILPSISPIEGGRAAISSLFFWNRFEIFAQSPDAAVTLVLIAPQRLEGDRLQIEVEYRIHRSWPNRLERLQALGIREQIVRRA